MPAGVQGKRRSSRDIERATAGAAAPGFLFLGSPVVPMFPFLFGVSLLKLNIRKKGTLIIKGLLGNLVLGWSKINVPDRGCFEKFSSGLLVSSPPTPHNRPSRTPNDNLLNIVSTIREKS